MAEQLILPRRILDGNGDPISGAKVYAYVAGTSTLEPIYSDEALTTAHPSPLLTDAEGTLDPVWHQGDHGVKIRVYDASDVELDWSPLDPAPMTSSATSAANITFTPTTNNPASDVQTAIENASALGREISTKAANYTALAADRGTVLLCTATLTLSLSAASVLGSGWFVYVLTSGGDVTIDPDGSETISGSATESLTDGESAVLFCDGSNFEWIKFETFATSLNKLVPTVVTRSHSTGYQNTNGQVLFAQITAVSSVNSTRPIQIASDSGFTSPIGVGIVHANGAGVGSAAVMVPNNWYVRINGNATISDWVEWL